MTTSQQRRLPAVLAHDNPRTGIYDPCMPDYRRAYVPGGTFFFTVVTYQRRRLFDVPRNRTLLGASIRSCQAAWPFTINAIVLLPDHLHTLWTLPRGDSNFSARWSVIKKEFTAAYLRAGGTDAELPSAQARENRRGVWQRRFWEHLIRDEDDFDTHFNYIHFNPVRHSLARCPRDWPASSFHRWVKSGIYAPDWACGSEPDQQPKFPATSDNYGEPT